MDTEFSDECERLVQSGDVRDHDIAHLREIMWANETISDVIVDELFRLNDHCDITSPVWIDFFVEAVEHYLLYQIQPHGFLTDGAAEWLRDRIVKEGRIASPCEMELLVRVLENAENAPDRLRIFALAEIEASILSGEGSTRIGASIRTNCVDEAEVVLLRRLIFAGDGDDEMIVSTEDADLLFRIKNATIANVNAPSWMALFVQGIGHHLMAHSDYRPLSPEEAQAWSGEMNHNAPDLFDFLKRTLPTEMIGYGTIVDAFKEIFSPQADPFAKTLTVAAARHMTADEAGWLKLQIAADGQTDVYEKALLTFVVEETGNLPSALTNLLRHG